MSRIDWFQDDGLDPQKRWWYLPWYLDFFLRDRSSKTYKLLLKTKFARTVVTLFMISEYRFYSFECMYTKFLLFSEIFSELLKLFFWIVFVQKNWMSSTSSCEMLLALYMLIYVVFLFWNIWQSTFVWENAFCFIDEN
jgi:hypothetical protein